MNDHAGWGRDGRCVWCDASEAVGKCRRRWWTGAVQWVRDVLTKRDQEGRS